MTLAASMLLHVMAYSTLMVLPAPALLPRIGLVAELVPSEPAPSEPPPVVEPRRPRPRPPERRIDRAPRPIQPPTPTPAPPSAIEATAVPPPTAPSAEPATGPATAAPFVAPEKTRVVAVDDVPPSRFDSVSADAGGSERTGATATPSTRTTAAASDVAAVRSGPLTQTAIPRGGYQIAPSYPATARRLGIEGTTLLSVFVEANGRVADVVVKQSAGHPDLDRVAAEAVRLWRFEPARHGTEAVAMWVELPVEFHLR